MEYELSSITSASSDEFINDFFVIFSENEIFDDDPKEFPNSKNETSEINSPDMQSDFNANNINANQCGCGLEIPGAKQKPIYKPHVKWTAAEDYRLKEMIKIFGDDNWRCLAKQMVGRNPRQCRERWQYYLSPELKIGGWSKEEDALIIEKTTQYGKKWKSLVQFFNHRTDAMIKNRYYVLLRQEKKKLRKVQNQKNKKIRKETDLLSVFDIDVSSPIDFGDDNGFHCFFNDDESNTWD